MKECFNIKFTISTSIVIGIILTLCGAYFGRYEVMYAGVGLLGVRTGLNAFGKNKNEK